MAEDKRKKPRGLILFLISLPGLWLCRQIVELSPGLPIDDAYIFKRYVFNIISGAGFSFNPGEPSFGCSSFLWTAWLSVLTRIFGREDYFFLAQWSGIIFTVLAIWYLLKLISYYTGSSWLILLGAFLGWLQSGTYMNAVSGMETGLFSYLVLAIIYRFALLEDKNKWTGIRLGIFCGLAFLTRPEGLYFVIVLSVLWLYQLIRGKKSVILLWLTFISGFAFIAVPYLVWMKFRFHQFLPFTYKAKIYSSDPEFLIRGLGKKIQDGIGFLLEGWGNLMGGWKVVGIIILVLAVASLVWALVKFFWRYREGALVLAGGWMLLPFAYGYSFPVSPHFGGYYQRYIASVYLVIILMGMVLLAKVLSKIPLKSLFYLLLLVLVIIYGIPIVRGQFREAKETYIKEVSLNQGLRLEGARWLKENTPESAQIMVGHTGLGVVGGESERKIYDLGGLINLDLLPYLEGTKPLTQLRWNKILQYICAKEIDYYVSFAPLSGVDPGNTPGFKEVARLGTQAELKSAYDQIRIYKLERNLFCLSEEKQGEK